MTLEERITAQDAKHGPFTGISELGRTRLIVACVEDEAREVREAWRANRKSEGWPELEDELLDLAAVCVRALRDLYSS